MARRGTAALIAALLVVTAPGLARAQSEPAARTERVAGANRYDTAARLAERFVAPVPAVWVTTGADYPDALAAAPGASGSLGPILLVQRDAVPAETAAALARLRPERIVIVGGVAAVSASVAATLADIAPTSRVAGPDRFATAAAVSRLVLPEGLNPDRSVVYLASGQGFADALGGGAAAAATPQTPLLLVRRDSVPLATADELARLRPETIVLVGGSAAVSGAVEQQLQGLAEVIRMAGPDRYGTAAELMRRTFGPGDPLWVATGTTFPDALAAGACGCPLLLVPAAGVPDSVAAAIGALRPSRATVVGGTAAVPPATFDRIASLVG
ncbi:MAG: cell wall-binding repeat-containing protein [Acidimicrobiales bacterium]|nr:cell wall-binding repeat-containing protein [Acidimicrobiales bacterium]